LIVTESLPPYSYQDGDVVKGMSTEVVQAVLHEVGIQADIHVYSWTRAYLLALTKPNVLIYSISRIPEREELFQWIGEVAPQGSYLFKLASRRDIQLNTLDDAKAYRIGTWRDDVSEQYLIGKGFVREQHLDNSGTPKQNILKLISQRLDLTSDAELSFYHQAQELGHDPALFAKAFRLGDLSQPLYMAFNRETPVALVEAFRKALASIKRQGLYEAIHRNYPSLSTRRTD
jgi:polar amino acid transport system substrate-binding protein